MDDDVQEGDVVNAEGQVAIVGGHAVVSQAGFVFTLEVGTGRMRWSRAGYHRSARLSVKGGKVTLKEGAKRQILDLKTGNLLESAP